MYLNTSMLKKGQQRRTCQRCLKENGWSIRPPINLYRSTIESILTGGILVWFGNTTTQDHKKYCKTLFRKSLVYHCHKWHISIPPAEETRFFTSQMTLITQHTDCLPSSLQTSVWEAPRHTPVASWIASIHRPSGCLTVALSAKCSYFLVYWMLV